MLTHEQKESIKNTPPDRIRLWELEHVARIEEANQEVVEKRRQFIDEWKPFLGQRREWVNLEENFRKKCMRPDIKNRNSKCLTSLTHSDTLSVTEELYKDD